MQDNNESKKRYPSQTRSVPSSTIISKPSPQDILQDALDVIAAEVLKFKHKSNKGISPTLAEGRVLTGYVKCLVDISRDLREADDSRDLSNLSDEELLKLVDTFKKQELIGGNDEQD